MASPGLSSKRSCTTSVKTTNQNALWRTLGSHRWRASQSPRLRPLTLLTFSVFFGLFLSAFGAATLLPLQSEAVLVALLLNGSYSPWWLVAVASGGNVLGSLLNWLLGLAIERFRERSWFPVSASQLQRAQTQYQRYGHWSLLLSWMPIIGDPLTLIAGVMREPLWRFIAIVTLAKTARYAILAAVTLGFSA